MTARKPPKPLTPLQALAERQKLPTVLDLLRKSLETTGITYLAKDIEYDYTNLSKVVKGTVKLPLDPCIRLAMLHGYKDIDGVFINAYQHMYPDENKSRAPRKRTPAAPAKPAKSSK